LNAPAASAMKLHIYRGLVDDEEIPEDVTHVIIDNSVAVIKRGAFQRSYLLVCVIMCDNVKRIEGYAFWDCHALRIIRLSKTLGYIGARAFCGCKSLEALVLPSTVKSIEDQAFNGCRSLRLMILPHDIDFGNIEYEIFGDTAIYQIAVNTGVKYEYVDIFTCTPESILRVNEWMYHHMDEFPLHKLCYSSSVTVKQINDYLIEHDDDGNGVLVTLAIDPHHGMNPLHMLAMNPHAPAEAIAALLDTNFQAIFRTDYKQNTPLDYARDYNVGGLVGMISGLCNHRNLSGPLRVGDTQSEHANKRMKLEHSIKID